MNMTYHTTYLDLHLLYHIFKVFTYRSCIYFESLYLCNCVCVCSTIKSMFMKVTFQLVTAGIYRNSWLLYVNLVFCKLTILISFKRFFENIFFEIFYTDDNAICEQRQFYFFLSNQYILFAFLFIELTKASSTLLNRSGGRWQHHLSPDI